MRDRRDRDRDAPGPLRSRKRIVAAFALLVVLQLVMLAWPVLARGDAGRVAAGQTLNGRVVKVSDGDTITLLVGRRQVRIRLAGIDAPEAGQPYGRASRRMLASLVAGTNVSVRVNDKDRYGRAVGRVTAGGVDASAAMVGQGGAWAYRRYLDDAALLRLEAEARRARRGLWGLQADQRVPPWEWRAARR